MLFIILCLIIWIISVVYVCKDKFNDGGDKIFLSSMSFLVAVGCCFLLTFVSSLIISSCVEVDQNLYKTIEVSALKDNSVIEGRSYLVSGYVNEEQSYYYMCDGEYGKYMDSISAKNSYIVENNDETPRVEKYEASWKNDLWYLLGWPKDRGINKIYVPEGSVIVDYYSIDMEG